MLDKGVGGQTGRCQRGLDDRVDEGSRRKTSGGSEVMSLVLDVEGHRLEESMRGQQEGGLVAFRTEACVSWCRELPFATLSILLF